MGAVSYEVIERVAHVTLDRPAKRNAMDLEVFDELAELAARAAGDADVGAVLVSGRGGVFSAGIDIGVLQEAFGGTAGLDAAFIGRLQSSFTAYEDLDVPTIAAIEGPCFGAGLQLALACHLRAVAPSASMAMMEAEWGLVPDLGGTWRLPRLVGAGRATELALTARRIDAREALRLGLAEVELPSDDPVEAAHGVAARLAAGPGALRLIPGLIRDNLGRDRRAALAAEATAQLRALAGPDPQEAALARSESRVPRFRGQVGDA